MERDFLGLASKSVPLTVKEEVTEGSRDSAMKGSAIQWSFSNKVSAIPQFLSFKAALEEKPRKSGHDPLTFPGFAAISAADALDSNQKSYPCMVQKSSNLDKPGANDYAMTTYAMQQFDAYQVHRPPQVRIFPVSNLQNQTITVSTSTPLLQSHGQAVASNSMNLQTLGALPVISPVPVHPTPGSIVGTTDLRNGPKSSTSPAQLTIFYAGSVCVYDDVSPEKAQAIMLLAGRGPTATHNKRVSTARVQSPILRTSARDGYARNKTHTSSLCSGLPSPISLASSSTTELAAVTPVVALASASNQTELHPKAISSIAPSSTTLFPSVAVPQARKASLARFLEKRKERVMNSSPYNVSKNSGDCTVVESNGMSLSVNSFSSQTHHLAAKGGL